MNENGSKGAARGYSEAELLRALAKLEKRWPKDTHWLYAASGTLHLMRSGPDGRPVMKPGQGGGTDPDYSIATFGGIRCDGGDW